MASELDSLAKWFKENVLETHQAGASTVANESFARNVDEATNSQTTDDDLMALAIQIAKDSNDELSLIEYIIGVDDIKP